MNLLVLLNLCLHYSRGIANIVEQIGRSGRDHNNRTAYLVDGWVILVDSRGIPDGDG
jgi:hypothetical protein